MTLPLYVEDVDLSNRFMVGSRAEGVVTVLRPKPPSTSYTPAEVLCLVAWLVALSGIDLATVGEAVRMVEEGG